ncbi:MAG: DNA internalization-related competence protein ComEC/Rec2 [Desulfotomaculum sp.]|nr:DNA internalization-related competence protein ComEC/Rec2 [Desulfotomaculum sp.]
MNRPLLEFCIVFILGIYLGSLLDISLWLLLIFSATLLILTIGCYLVKSNYARWLMVGLCLLTGIMTMILAIESNKTVLVQYAGESLSLTGALVREPDVRPEKVFYLVQAREIQVDDQIKPVHGLVRVTVREPEQVFEYGDLITASGRLKIVPPPGNPGQFDYRCWLERRGIHVVMSVWDHAAVEKVGRAYHGGFKGLALAAKQHLQVILQKTLPPEQAALMQGMLFGNRGMISEQVSEDFQTVSLVHVLCVSGFHVGLVLAGFLGLFHLLRLPLAWEAPAGTLLLVFYATMTGLGPAVIRATIMGLAVLWARRLGRERDWPTVMALAAAMILMLWPQALWEPGFQLSFAVTWGILYLTPLAEKGLGNWPRPLRLALAIPLVAELTAAPLVAYHFNMVSLVGVIANAILGPLISAVMLLAGASVLIGLIILPVANIINAVTGTLLDLMLWIVHNLAAWPQAAVFIPPPPEWLVVGYYLCLAAIPKIGLLRPTNMIPSLSLDKPRLLARVLPLIIILSLPVLFLWLGNDHERLLTVHFIDVGQGDATLIQTPNGKNMLIDTGGWSGEFESNSGAGNKVVLPYLQYLGVSHLDVLILTHPHEDHAGGTIGIIQHLPVAMVIVTPLASGVTHGDWEQPDDGYLQLLLELEKRELTVQEAVAGQTLQLDPDLQIAILAPAKPLPDLNDSSLVIKMTYYQRSFLFTGDIGIDKQQQLLQQQMVTLPADILKVPHHGSRFFAPEFFAVVNPAIAVISAGRNNRFGHPAPETLQVLDDLATRIYRTDLHGAVIISTDGLAVWVERGIISQCNIIKNY